MNPTNPDYNANPQAQPAPTPPARPNIQVPQRPVNSVHDIDDSAFNVGEEQTPVAPVQAPQAPVLPPPVPTPRPPAPPAAAPTSPAPVTAPSSSPAPVASPANPPGALPPHPQAPPELSRIPPMPVTPVEVAPPPTQLPPPSPPSPRQATPPQAPAPPPPSAAPYQPPSPHIAKDLIERIDEKPQQNSKDIETLIEHNHRLHRLKSFASFLAFCASVVIAAFLINQFIFQSYYVDGSSMTPTLHNNDRLIIDKVERSISNLQSKPYVPVRGQIVVLDSSIIGLGGREEQLIKRVIGLPGDTVSINEGVVTVKNQQNPNGFDVNRQLGLQLQPTYVESPQEWTIEPNQVFVMGDNRAENGSFDSRAFGPIKSEDIVGRLWARILPFEKAQIF